MIVKPVIRPDKRGNMVVSSKDGVNVKLFATYGPGSKRRCYDFIDRQKRSC